MAVIVISPKGCSVSAKRLAEAIGAEYTNPYKSDRYDFTRYDGVVNYGCSQRFRSKNHVNSAEAVGRCVDKRITFKLLKEAGVPHPGFCTNKADIPKEWTTVVIRPNVFDRAGNGLDYWYRWENKPIPDAQLYTNYFEHTEEYRITVLFGEVVGRYRKDRKEGWEFNQMEPEGFEEIDKACIKAAKAIGIDYVGFDVVENAKAEFQILEANSGPILTDDVLERFVKAFKG